MRARTIRFNPWQGSERRAFRRLEAELPARVWVDGQEFACQTSDISLGGAMVDGSFPARNGSTIELELEGLPALAGLVVHAGTTFLGVEFSISHEERQRLANWIEQRLLQRS